MKTRTLVLIPIFIFVAIAIFIFPACDTGKNGGGGDPALVGTWIGTEVGHFTTWTMVFQETTWWRVQTAKKYTEVTILLIQKKTQSGLSLKLPVHPLVNM